MSGSNSNVVRRTWGLLQTRAPPEFAYGDAFDYEEFMHMDTTRDALILSLATFVGFALAINFPPVSHSHFADVIHVFLNYSISPPLHLPTQLKFRWFIKAFFLPKSGDGPSPEFVSSDHAGSQYLIVFLLDVQGSQIGHV